MSQERHEFQAEIKQLLDLMIHSLYSDRDIFLRELISNASDALDKLRFELVANPDLLGGADASELHIRLATDADAKTVIISDNGVGMSRAEVLKNIGTIAKSGTKEFLAAAKAKADGKLTPELIGQFGVGFYSSFMVADRVELVTRRAGEATATKWVSTGDGSYTVEDATRETQGTTITLHLKSEADETAKDYTKEWTLRDIVRKYSDFVAYPIRMQVSRKADKDAEPTLEDETLNSMKAIWDRSKGEVTEEEYQEFYRHISHDWQPPARTIPVKIEGTFEANALMFIPSKAPFDLYNPEMKRGLQLYVKRVFVMDECRDLMPTHFRFIKGVVDAHDLSLNVSREILQKDRQIGVIKKQLVKKVLGTLDDMRRNAPKDYLTFWGEFGPVMKEGLVAYDDTDKAKLLDLVLATSTAKTGLQPEFGTLTTLEGYVERMQPGQEAIYVLTGPSQETLAKSPLLESFNAKGYEVLLFADPIDELWLEHAPTFKDKKIVSIGRGEVKLGSEEEQKQAAEALEAKQKDFADLLACFRVHLQHDIKEVRLSNRLTSSPACVVSDAGDMTPRMQRMMEQMGQKPEKVKRILELNPEHALVQKISGIFKQSGSDPRLQMFAELLYAQAALAETGAVPNPGNFAEALAQVMLKAAE